MSNILDFETQEKPKRKRFLLHHPMLVFFGFFLGLPLAILLTVSAIIGLFALPLCVAVV